MTKEELMEIWARLDLLAARLEDEGRYVDANIVVSAYMQICGVEPPIWKKKVNELWDDPDGIMIPNSVE